jgi:hypothetical protein
MNKQLENYLDLQNRINRIENLTNADWDTKYMLRKFVPVVWNDGFDVQDIIDYITIKLSEVITELENEKQITTTHIK